MPESKKKSFNHIKIHSQYSICEGALKIENLKEYCKKNKIQSVGLSDTYNLSGALEFSENISSVGTQPIIGWAPDLEIFSENSKAPKRFDVSESPMLLILISLQYSFNFSI